MTTNEAAIVPFWQRLREICLYPAHPAALTTLAALAVSQLVASYLPLGFFIGLIVWVALYKYAFECLRDLDCRDPRQRAALGRELPPRLEGLAVAPEPAERPGSFGGDPVALSSAVARQRGTRPVPLDVRRIACPPAVERGVEALERVVMPALAPEQPGEAGEVAPRRRDPADRVREVALEVAEEPGERPDIELVVADDVDEAGGAAAADEVEVAARDLPALDVPVPAHPEEVLLGRPQPGVR